MPNSEHVKITYRLKKYDVHDSNNSDYGRDYTNPSPKLIVGIIPLKPDDRRLNY